MQALRDAPLVNEVNPPRRWTGIIANTVGVGMLTAVAKIAGAGKSVAIARIFGSSMELDAYLLAFLVPSFAVEVFCGSLVPALVPALVESQKLSSTRTLSFQAQVQRRYLRYAGAAGCSLLLISWAFASSSSNLEYFRFTASMVAIMSPMLPLAALSNVWRAVLNSCHCFLIPAASAVVVPFVMVAAVLIAGKNQGIATLAWATTLAVFAELALLATGMRHAGQVLFPRATDVVPLGHFFREYSYLTAATAVTAGSYFIGQSLAATLSAGSVSIFNYGTRLIAVLLGVGPAALAVTVLPHFSAMTAKRDGWALRESLTRMLMLSGLFGAALAVGLIVFSARIIQITLEHGAFTPENTAAVSIVQQISLIQLPFVICNTLLMRTLAALESNRGLLPISLGILAINALFNYSLSARFGVPGIALATSISQAILFITLIWFVFRDKGQRFRLERPA